MGHGLGQRRSQSGESPGRGASFTLFVVNSLCRRTFRHAILTAVGASLSQAAFPPAHSELRMREQTVETRTHVSHDTLPSTSALDFPAKKLPVLRAILKQPRGFIYHRCVLLSAITCTSDPQLAAMEKAKLVVFNSGKDEEPVACTRHLCRLEGLETRTVGLDDIMAAPEGPDRWKHNTFFKSKNFEASVSSIRWGLSAT